VAPAGMARLDVQITEQTSTKSTPRTTLRRPLDIRRVRLTSGILCRSNRLGNGEGVRGPASSIPLKASLIGRGHVLGLSNGDRPWLTSQAPLARAVRGRIGAGDAAIGNVLGPLCPRPVPLVVLGERVGEPSGRDAGERRAPLAPRGD